MRTSKNRIAFLTTCAAALLLCRTPRVAAQDAFASAREAYVAALQHLKSMDHAKARVVLEQALKLGPDDKLKRDIYRALAVPYRGLAEIEPLLGAMEYLIRNPASAAEQSLARYQIVGHVKTHGKGKQAAERYEAMLKKNPVDWTALYILSSIYADVLEDAKNAAAVTQRLIDVTKKQGDPVDPRAAEQLAKQHAKAGRHAEAAALFEKVAALDKKMTAWNLKEAATAWLKAGDKDKAVTAAKASAAAPPEERSTILAHFWHRHLGEVFLETGENALAIEHFTKAIAKTDVQGYKDDCQRKIEEAKKRSVK